MSDQQVFYQEQAKTFTSAVPWVASLQNQGLQYFIDKGLPHQKNEDWKYTSLKQFNQYQFSALPSQTVAAYDLPPVTIACHADSLNHTVQCQSESISTEICILPLLKAIQSREQDVKAFLNKIVKIQHGFHALNQAYLNDGFFICVPENKVSDLPVLISQKQTVQHHATFRRNLIIVKKNAQLTMIEDYTGAPETEYFTNQITEIFLEENASLTHVKMIREGNRAFHFSETAVHQSKNSQFNSHIINLGGTLVRGDIDIQMLGEGANCTMNGIYLPASGHHVDHHTTVWHKTPHTQSKQDYKGIIQDGRAVFNGRVVVEKGAQQTEAQQQNKNILLSPRSSVDTKPQLEIFADDVICSHGATVGQLDDDALFYLETRGIGKELATQYLVKAFTADNLNNLPNREIREWTAQLINQQLGWNL